jgi:O-Antigen ligase.
MQTWSALVIVVLIPALCMLTGQAGILRFVFPLLSVGVGGFLLWRSKPLYVGYVMWLWFLTPFIARIVDFQGGWTPANPVEIAPYMNAALSGLPLLASIHRLATWRKLPYVCALVAVLYGFILGVVYLPLFNVFRALVNWLVPVLFGLYIYENGEYYVEFRRVISKAFLLGTLILGIYGAYQFFVLPDWDRAWMLNVRMNSFGEIEAMKTRAFSTMNAPAIYAAVTATGLLLLFNLRGKMRLLAIASGFVGLVLTLSRASWLSLAVGCAYLVIFLSMRERYRLMLGALSCFAILLSVAQIPAVHDIIWQRVETFTQPGQDVSYSARVEGHDVALRQIAEEPWGEGIGSTDTLHNTEGDDDIIGPHDSTLLEILYSLGWIGTLIYGVGMFLLAVRLFRAGRGDYFALAAKAILIGLFAQALLNSILLGVLGFMVWTFASMCLAEMEQRKHVSEAMNQEVAHSAELFAAWGN